MMRSTINGTIECEANSAKQSENPNKNEHLAVVVLWVRRYNRFSGSNQSTLAQMFYDGCWISCEVSDGSVVLGVIRRCSCHVFKLDASSNRVLESTFICNYDTTRVVNEAL